MFLGIALLTVAMLALYQLHEITAFLNGATHQRERHHKELMAQLRPTAPQPPQAFPHRQDLVQVLTHTHDGWTHHSWAQDGTHACKHAIETPGMAVKRGENVDYGVQS